MTAGVGRSLWHGHAHMPSVINDRRVIVRGDGAFIWDSEGKRLLDLTAGLWCCNVGHGREEIADSVSGQLSTLACYSNFSRYATLPALELADRLAELAPIPAARVFFTSGGSDAAETAAKLSRRYWQAMGRPEKRVIVSRDRCYHGLHGFGTSIAGLPANAEGYGPLIPDVELVPHDDWQALEALLAQGGSERVAALFIEPVIGAGGVYRASSSYLRNVQRLCREYDVLLVADEVITGFGRTGNMFASAAADVEPDILMFAKGVTSGYQPLGGVIVGERVAEPFWADESELVFRHGLTYQGHAAACAAGVCNLEILAREELVGWSRLLGVALSAALAPLRQHPDVVEVRLGGGLMAAVELADADVAAAVAERCWEAGLATRQIGTGEALQISPPLSITEADLLRGCELLAEAVEHVSMRPRSAL